LEDKEKKPKLVFKKSPNHGGNKRGKKIQKKNQSPQTRKSESRRRGECRAVKLEGGGSPRKKKSLGGNWVRSSKKWRTRGKK